MQKTYRAVERIEQGQLDDRIGLMMAGRDQILLAAGMDDAERSAEITAGRSSLLIAQQQLLKTYERRINEFDVIPARRIDRFKREFRHKGYLQEKDQEFKDLQKYYSLYLTATRFLAASYEICGLLVEAEKVFSLADEDLKSIDFTGVKTIQYLDPALIDPNLCHTADHIEAEQADLLKRAREYDMLELRISGKKLLEAIDDGKSD